MYLINTVAVLITNPLPACKQKCAPDIRLKTIACNRSVQCQKMFKLKKDYLGYGYSNHPEQIPNIKG